MIYDKDFLLKLDKVKNKIVHAKITALTFDERPIESVEGRVTQGSINVDGASAVRRTCSLTIIAENFNYQNYYWGLNTKFKLEIGVENYIDPSYPSIIWFKQGIYLFTSFNVSRSTNSFNISIQGKDKMCLLNGEVGGSLESSIDFGKIEEETTKGVWTIRSIPLRDIIRNAVHTYAGEPYRNIIINDLEDYGLELLEYRYDIPMFLYRTLESNIYNNIVMNSNLPCQVDRVDNETGTIYRVSTTLGNLLPTELDILVDPLTGSENPSPIWIEGKQYYVAKIEYGQTAGYRLTDLTYAGDLIANVGEAITSVLDKIKNMLSEFEYFYDLDGQFIFQKKKSFINTLWTPILEGLTENDEGELYSEKYIQSMVNSSSWSYVFNGGELITSFNNNPNLLNMRNDYSVWGQRKSVSGQDIPVHLRYAIDIKPEYYVSFDKKLYTTKEDIKTELEVVYTDWREIIYQMAKDYYKHNQEDNFELELRSNNLEYYPTGQTGYERYYIDIEGFWRQLYDPEPKEEDKENYYPEGHKYQFWLKNVYECPETLNFWFDFLDTEGELSQFNVKNVGARSKAVNETTIKSIYFRETPDVIFQSSDEDIQPISGYKYIQVQDIDSMFSISAQGKSAKDRLDELIYNHGYCIESATITTIPIYYLQPNTRIHLSDSQTNLNGDYIISKMTIPLTHNGTMQITATKAAESII